MAFGIFGEEYASALGSFVRITSEGRVSDRGGGAAHDAGELALGTWS